MNISIIASRCLALLLALLLAAPLLGESYIGKRVEVLLKGGGKVVGVVIEEPGDGSIKVQVAFGQVWLKPDRIDKINIQKPPEEEFQDRSRNCKTADDWVKLAQWCGLGDINLPARRKECLEKALQVDPNHEGAHLELGHVKVGDTWYPEEEGNKRLGKVKYNDRWVTPQEAERLKRIDELKKKNRYLKGLLEEEEARRGVPWATAKPIEKMHYIVKCNSTDKVAQRYSNIMEALYRAYDEVFSEKDYPRYSGDKGTIYIFRNHQEFVDFTMQPGAGGFFSFADRAVRAFHGSFGVTGSTEMVLAHEATHQFQSRIMRNMMVVPTWLIEGMAVYYGDGTNISENRVELHQIPRDRLQTLQEAIETGRYTQLNQLLRIPHAMFGGQFYDHGWGVIYWCLQGEKHKAHKGEGKKIWDQYLRHACNEMPDFATYVSNPMKHLDDEAKYFIELVKKETGKSVDDWEADYKKFILSLELKALGTWKTGNIWDGSSTVGIQLKFPAAMKKVAEKQLRRQYREDAAAESADGQVRMFLIIDSLWLEQVDDPDMLKNRISGIFNTGEFEEEPRDVMVKDVFKTFQATFKGRYLPRRERATGSDLVDREKGKKASGEEKKKKKEDSKQPADKGGSTAPDYSVVQKVRAAMIPTSDKVYLIFLAGPEAPFSKIEPQFQEVLESVRLSF